MRSNLILGLKHGVRIPMKIQRHIAIIRTGEKEWRNFWTVGITENIGEVLNKAEEAGLVHATLNRQEIDFLCNCCGCHCMILKTALAQPKPGLSLNSGFKPRHDRDLCTSCGTCIDRCPTQALAMDSEDKPALNLDRCIGCGVCTTGCAFDAISLVERAGILAPPMDQKALREAIKASQVY